MRFGSIYNRCAVEVANELEAGSVRLVYGDGPYGLNKGDWDKATGRALVEWYAPHFDAWDRVCMPSASVALWGITRSWAYLHCAMEDRGWTQCGQIVWDKGNATTTMRADPDALRSWAQTHEIVGLYRRESLHAPQRAGSSIQYAAGGDDRNWIREWIRSEWSGAGLTQAQANQACGTQMAGHYFGRSQWALPTWDHFCAMAAFAAEHGAPLPSSRSGRPWMVHESCDGERATFEHLRAEFEHLRAEFEHLRAPFNLERVQPSVWRETPPTMSADRHGHECEKPPGLTRRLIEVLTLPGETVFEPFGGSSPVARVCEGMTPADARRWVSCETDAKHYARTVQMLSRSQMGLL